MKNIFDSVLTFFTQSSENPEQTSATLTGILIAAASFLHQYAAYLPVLDKFFNSEIGQQLDPILAAIGMAVGGIWFLFGVFRKISNKIESSNGLRIE